MRTAAQEVFDDLLNLEVDIILKNGMTARKMPDVPHALIDIFTDDDTAMILKRIYRNCDQIKGILKGRAVDGGERSEQLEKVAQAGITRADASTTDLPLTADEVLIIRKAWEVGTETVVMQTVVQLD